jgi:hypothetical protein
VTFDAINIDFEYLDDDLNSIMGTETLITNNLVSDGLPASDKAPA